MKRKVFKIFEKISPLIDELDTLLSKYKPDPERIKILSDVISYSLMSSNPVRSLKDTISFYLLCCMIPLFQIHLVNIIQ